MVLRRDSDSFTRPIDHPETWREWLERFCRDIDKWFEFVSPRHLRLAIMGVVFVLLNIYFLFFYTQVRPEPFDLTLDIDFSKQDLVTLTAKYRWTASPADESGKTRPLFEFPLSRISLMTQTGAKFSLASSCLSLGNQECKPVDYQGKDSVFDLTQAENTPIGKDAFASVQATFKRDSSKIPITKPLLVVPLWHRGSHGLRNLTANIRLPVTATSMAPRIELRRAKPAYAAELLKTEGKMVGVVIDPVKQVASSNRPGERVVTVETTRSYEASESLALTAVWEEIIRIPNN